MSNTEIDAVLRSAEWHQRRGAEKFKIQLLEIIMSKIDQLNDEDAAGHTKWGDVFDFISNTEFKNE